MRLGEALHRAGAGHDTGLGGPWLAVGRVAGRALRDLGARTREVDDVHHALEVLDREGHPFVGCLVGARTLRDRPGRALEVLRLHLGDHPLFVLGGKSPAGVRQAARALGIDVCRPGDRTRLADTDGTAPALPRADGRPGQEIETLDRRFAAGCLSRLGDPSAIRSYTLRTLRELSGATRISLMIVRDGGRVLEHRVESTTDDERIGTMRCPIGQGIAGRAATLGRPQAGHGTSGGTRGYEGTAYVVLPLGRGTECVGVVNLTGLPEDRLPPEPILSGWAEVGGQAGLALANAWRLVRAESDRNTDPLTGLPNRRSFENALAREVERATRSGDGLAVALFDADRFKRVNDEHGHPAGDRVLVALAQRLSKSFRDSDLVARWGGEEFAVLLPGIDAARPDASLRALERARQLVGDAPIEQGPGLPDRHVTVSGGVAFHPTNGRQGDILVRAADGALLEAKRTGRDRICRA